MLTDLPNNWEIEFVEGKLSVKNRKLSNGKNCNDTFNKNFLRDYPIENLDEMYIGDLRDYAQGWCDQGFLLLTFKLIDLTKKNSMEKNISSNNSDLFDLKNETEQSNLNNQFNLGLKYLLGDGTAIDKKKAFKWFEKSAKQGQKDAQFNLAGMHYFGDGTQINKKKAFFWYKKSADQGSADAQYSIGKFYYQGNIIETDKQKALYWLNKSAEQGNVGSQFLLSTLYADEFNDLQKTIFWLKKAAQQEHEVAQMALGKMFYEGIGVKKSKKQAMYWLKKSSTNGNQEAKDLLNEYDLN